MLLIAPPHLLVKYNKFLKMLDTSTSIGHHIVHFSILQNGYLDTSKTMSNGMIFKIIETFKVTGVMTYKLTLQTWFTIR